MAESMRHAMRAAQRRAEEQHNGHSHSAGAAPEVSSSSAAAVQMFVRLYQSLLPRRRKSKCSMGLNFSRGSFHFMKAMG